MIEDLKSNNMKFIDLDQKIGKANNGLRMLEHDKEKVLERFNLLRDHLKPKLDLIQRQLDTLLDTKSSYTDHNAAELAAYGLCGIIRMLKHLKLHGMKNSNN